MCASVCVCEPVNELFRTGSRGANKKDHLQDKFVSQNSFQTVRWLSLHGSNWPICRNVYWTPTSLKYVNGRRKSLL